MSPKLTKGYKIVSCAFADAHFLALKFLDLYCLQTLALAGVNAALQQHIILQDQIETICIKRDIQQQLWIVQKINQW